MLSLINDVLKDLLFTTQQRRNILVIVILFCNIFFNRQKLKLHW